MVERICVARAWGAPLRPRLILTPQQTSRATERVKNTPTAIPSPNRSPGRFFQRAWSNCSRPSMSWTWPGLSGGLRGGGGVSGAGIGGGGGGSGGAGGGGGGGGEMLAQMVKPPLELLTSAVQVIVVPAAMYTSCGPEEPVPSYLTPLMVM